MAANKNVDIMSVLNADAIATYIESIPPTQTIGAQLFPVKKQMGIDLTMIKGAEQRPVALKMAQFDTDVRIRTLKASIVKETKEMPFFKEAIVLREKDRQNLLLAMQGGNEEWRDLILDQIYENIASLVDGADIQVERMRMQLLGTGAIKLTGDDGDLELDYGLPAEQNIAVSAFNGTDNGHPWSDHEKSTPIQDLENWVQKMVDLNRGVPRRLVLTRKIVRHLQKNQSIINDISSDSSNKKIITENVLLDYLREKTGLQIALIDGSYLGEDGELHKYYPENKITLLPDGALGSTYYGTTPEEADLMTNNANANNVRTVNNKTICTIKKQDPVTVLTKVSQVVLPSCEKISQIFIAQVTNDADGL